MFAQLVEIVTLVGITGCLQLLSYYTELTLTNNPIDLGALMCQRWWGTSTTAKALTFSYHTGMFQSLK